MIQFFKSFWNALVGNWRVDYIPDPSPLWTTTISNVTYTVDADGKRTVKTSGREMTDEERAEFDKMIKGLEQTFKEMRDSFDKMKSI
jgi:hypothetical protein